MTRAEKGLLLCVVGVVGYAASRAAISDGTRMLGLTPAQAAAVSMALSAYLASRRS